MTLPILTLSGVEKRYGAAVAVTGFDLAVEKGEFVALMGPSGCGKTTTLRMLAGLERPDAGEIRLWSRVVNDLAPWERDMPMVWQSYALFPFLDVLGNVEFGLRQRRHLDRRGRRAKAMEWLERLGIADFARRGVDQLSGGQRQRVALARALVLEPEVLLLDEPLSALDPHLRVRMQALLTRLHGELGITFVYVTHSQSEAFALANRVVIMGEGRIQQVGSPQDIYRAPANRFVAEFVGASNVLTGRVTGSGDGRLTIEGPAGPLSATAAPPARRAGAEAAFVVAADRIAIAPSGTAPPPGHDALEGRVATEEFVGALVSVFVDLETGQQIFVQKQQHEIARLGLKPGSPVVLSWPTDAVYVLPG